MRSLLEHASNELSLANFDITESLVFQQCIEKFLQHFNSGGAVSIAAFDEESIANLTFRVGAEWVLFEARGRCDRADQLHALRNHIARETAAFSGQKDKPLNGRDKTPKQSKNIA